MKKLLFVGLLALLPLSGSLASCKDKVQGSYLTERETRSAQAVTSINLIQQAMSAPSLAASPLIKKKASMSEEQIKQTQAILPTLSLLLDNGSSFDSKVDRVDTVIEDKTYAYKETLSFKNVKLQTETYTLVYNKDIKTETNDDEDDKRETETHEVLTGYAYIGETEMLPFTCESETEKEGNKSEEERTFKIDVAPGTYIKVEQEVEIKNNKIENEFKYTFVADNQVVIEYSIEIEHKQNKQVIEYETGGVEYEVTRRVDKTDGKTYFDVEIETETGETETEVAATFVQVVKEDGTVSFEHVTTAAN